MFADDRDLLVFEPNLPRDVAWAGQRLVAGAASVSGSTMTVTTSDVALDAAGVTTGHVALLNGIPIEVIERLSSTTATVSRLRASPLDPVFPLGTLAASPMSVVTFRPQLSLVHARVLSLLGASGDEGAEFEEGQILNAGALRVMTALGALQLIYSAAAALGDPSSAASVRAEVYRRLFNAERERVRVAFDTNGDGLVDVTRAMGEVALRR